MKIIHGFFPPFYLNSYLWIRKDRKTINEQAPVSRKAIFPATGYLAAGFPYRYGCAV